MQPLYRFLYAIKARIALAILTSIISGSSSATLIGLINHRLTSSAPISNWFVPMFGGLVMLSLASQFISRMTLLHVSTYITFELKSYLTQQIFNTPLSDLEKVGQHRLLAALTYDVRILSAFFAVLPDLSISFTIIIGCLVYLIWLSPFMGLALILTGSIIFLSYWRLHRQILSFLKLSRLEIDTTYDYYKTMLEGIKSLKLYSHWRTHFWKEKLRPNLDTFRQKNLRSGLFQQTANTISQMLYFIFVTILFIYVTLQPLDMTILTSYAVAALYLKSNLGHLLQTMPTFSRAKVAWDKLNSLDLAEPTAKEDESQFVTTTTSKPTWQTLALRNVSYTYRRHDDDRPFKLGPLTMTFHPAEIVFLTGGNGSGKTTFAKLVTTLYPTEAGQIFLDGQAVTAKTKAAYRQQFATIFSDGYLGDSLLMQPPAEHTQAQIETQVTRLQLANAISIEDGTFSTADLSFGQRKRLALLIALLEDRPIYLFDEWAAGQDVYFKAWFYQEFLPQLKTAGKLVLVITHDEPYYDCADRLIKFTDGQIESEYDQRTKFDLSPLVTQPDYVS